mmetsp:Transcript_17148/g.49940  ORF Transcript_17148/g.49940 Transcript_17148/m.49940 type:complete len:390 (-) Transcript_17148:188-1357(-)
MLWAAVLLLLGSLEPSGAWVQPRTRLGRGRAQRYSVEDVPGSLEALVEPSGATSGYMNQQTMLRVKDGPASVEFYTKVLGMSLLRRYDFEEYSFSLMFMGYADPTDIPEAGVEKTMFLLRQLGTIELTWNWGTEEDNAFPGYADGNDEERGFGHIGLTVPDVYAACRRFDSLGVKYRKRPDEGGMKGLAFILDPDGYSVEILSSTRMAGGISEDGNAEGTDAEEEDPTRYAMTQTMLRVRDPAESLRFYSEVLGMRLLNDIHFPEYSFSLYFMGYCDPKDVPKDKTVRTRWCFEQCAAVELTHNWGTEAEKGFRYSNGNDEEKRGFGHIGLVVPDVYEACDRFSAMGVDFRKEPDSGGMKRLAFIRDPDGYSIEILDTKSLAPFEDLAS